MDENSYGSFTSLALSPQLKVSAHTQFLVQEQHLHFPKFIVLIPYHVEPYSRHSHMIDVKREEAAWRKETTVPNTKPVDRTGPIKATALFFYVNTISIAQGFMLTS